MTNSRRRLAAPWVSQTAEESPRRRGLPGPPSRLFVHGVVPSTTRIVCHRRRRPLPTPTDRSRMRACALPPTTVEISASPGSAHGWKLPGLGSAPAPAPGRGPRPLFRDAIPVMDAHSHQRRASSVRRRCLVSADGSKTSVSSHRGSGRLLQCMPTVAGIKRNRRRRAGFAALPGSRRAPPSPGPCAPDRGRRTDPLRPRRGATR